MTNPGCTVNPIRAPRGGSRPPWSCGSQMLAGEIKGSVDWTVTTPPWEEAKPWPLPLWKVLTPESGTQGARPVARGEPGPSGRCVGVQPDDSLRRRLVDGSGGRSLDLGKREGHAPPPSAGVDSSGRMDAHRRDGPVAMRRRRRLSSGAGTGSSLGPRARSPSIRPPFPRSRGPRLKAPGLPGCVAAPRARTALYEPAEHRGLALQFAQDINVRAFCYFSLALWHRGYPDQASQGRRRSSPIRERVRARPHARL